MRRETDWLLVLLFALPLAACSGAGTRKEAMVDTDAQRAAEVNVELGQGYMQRGDNEVALEKLESALRLDPNSSAAHSVIAVLYERIGKPERAEEHYRRSTELTPEKGEMLNNYGAFLCRNGRYSEADGMFQRALADPFYKTSAALLGNAGVCAMNGGHLDAAKAYFRRALKIDANQQQALFQMAQSELRDGNALSARGFIQRYEGVAPVSPQLLDLAAQIESTLGDEQSAASYRERLQNEYPDYRPLTTSGETNSQ